MTYKTVSKPALLCLSHLRWDFVFQRPQHLMSRFARERSVLFVEEPLFEPETVLRLNTRLCPKTGVEIITPLLPESTRRAASSMIRGLLSSHLDAQEIRKPIAWFYTPMALEYCPPELSPSLVIYDCMDELSLFRNPPARLHINERQLFRIANLVFTGGVSLFEHKRSLHERVYAFPSGVDIQHFAQARFPQAEPPEQADIPRPRVGYAGVIDERLDLDLIREVADLRPEWQLMMVGPVVKIDSASLPRRANIHWLGMKPYEQLPAYFSGWDAAMMPFAMNDATRFISPTKTPEYLSAGLPVISTPVRDVVRPYGELGLARIVHSASEFVLAAEQVMQRGMSLKWRERADAFLRTLSWDSVWSEMNRLIQAELEHQNGRREFGMPAGQEVARV